MIVRNSLIKQDLKNVSILFEDKNTNNIHKINLSDPKSTAMLKQLYISQH
jgi:hypothetical protein